MSNLSSKFMNRVFRRVGGIVWDLTTGKIGIKDQDGSIFSLETVEGPSVEGAQPTPAFSITVNPFEDFGVELPAFATTTNLADVKLGDLVVGDSKILGWVTAKTGASLTLLSKDGMKKQYSPPKVDIMGLGAGVLVVQNLVNLTGGSDGLAGFQSMLLPMLMMKDTNESFDLERILPFMLFSQKGGESATAFNPMMLMAMSSGGLGDLDPMLLMAMSGGFGGQQAGGFNPMLAMALMKDKKEVKEAPAPLRPALQPC